MGRRDSGGAGVHVWLRLFGWTNHTEQVTQGSKEGGGAGKEMEEEGAVAMGSNEADDEDKLDHASGVGTSGGHAESMVDDRIRGAPYVRNGAANGRGCNACT